VSQAAQPSEEDAAGRIAGVREFEIVLPWDADVGFRDRLVVGGAVYEVAGTDGGRSWPAALRARCVRIE
jgi:hypothetical protein